jgi:hypothetical protein
LEKLRLIGDGFSHFLVLSFFVTPQRYPFIFQNVVGVYFQDQDMSRRVTAGTSCQRIDAEPIVDPNTYAEQTTFADFQKDFNRGYSQFYASHVIDEDLKRRISEFELSIAQFEKSTLNKQYQRYITLDEGKIRFDEIPVRPHGEIAGLLTVMISRQVLGPTFSDGLECASDNGMLFDNNPNDHRLHNQPPFC